MFLQLVKCLIENRQYRYLAVGLWNTLVGVGIFSGLYFLFHQRLHYLAIAFLSYFLSVCHAWLGFRYFVFRSKAPWLQELLRFHFSYLFVFSFQLVGLWSLVDFAGVHPVVSQVVMLMLSVLLSYVMHTLFSFKQVVFHDGQE